MLKISLAISPMYILQSKKNIGNRKVKQKKSKDDGARIHRCTKSAFSTSKSIFFERFFLEKKSVVEKKMSMIHIAIEIMGRTSA
ncbi:MAG: hypothetical protein AVW06_01965 [Hadesarchaea archaeon DG-33-1]|nr:MAG: hypothetical protein AVW06_01965 [Hadesarchaea archaeon DG-33-1]